jgi:maltooligosyltrehalose trehalohydrolase
MRELPIGAEPQEGGTHFRVWAPRCRRVEVMVEGGSTFALEAERGGYFSGRAARVEAGARYRFRLDGGDAFPDPASRFQPEGPHGPSEVVDPWRFRWSDRAWAGLGPEGQVAYEMHVGTFTPQGTWDAAQALLPGLAELGITAIELMPVADFAGRYGWGYDGVNLFAPTRLYGRPDDLRRFVDEAHRLGLGVILDVVYNHFGPDGNYLPRFSAGYLTSRHRTDWGEAVNFDGEDSAGVREFVLANAVHWIREYHLDGLRLDATQDIHDDSERHILAELAAAARGAAGGRRLWMVAENEPQQTRLVRPPQAGGLGLDALWNDDFHHSAMVALTGRREAYYTDYLGSPQELLSEMKYGYLYQGQRYRWQKQRRGTPALDLPRHAFVNFIQNHDQVANSARGLRAHALSSPGRYRALTGLLLLSPGTPMLFQGQEFCSSKPFFFFVDQPQSLAEPIRAGRREFLAQFRSLALPEWDLAFADPSDPATFAACVLDQGERQAHPAAFALHRDLIRLRRTDPVLTAPRAFDGAVLSPHAWLQRWLGPSGDDRLLVINLGPDLHLDPAPEPLLAPPLSGAWQVRWSSEDRAYGGQGTPELDTEENWRIPGEAAVLLTAGPCP